MHFMSYQVLQATPQAVVIIPNIPRHHRTGCKINKLIELQLVQGLLVNCSVERSTWPLRCKCKEIWVFDPKAHQNNPLSQLSKRKNIREHQGSPHEQLVFKLLNGKTDTNTSRPGRPRKLASSWRTHNSCSLNLPCNARYGHHQYSTHRRVDCQGRRQHGQRGACI